jgi:predicted RNase H-like HicB family nuclease
MRNAIAIEKTATCFSAYGPDLPGCIATGDSKAEIEHEMQGAIRCHIDRMIEDGLPVPEPMSIVEYVAA